MLRIITKESNKKIKREYRARFAIKFMWSMILVLVVVAVFVFPSYVLLHYYQNAHTDSTVVRQQESVQKISDQYNELLQKTYKFSQQAVLKKSSHMQVADLIFGYAQSGLVFDAIELESEDDGIILVTLRGRSSSREALLAFESGIKSNPNFEGFEIPIDSLRMQNNIPINLTFAYHEE